MSSQSQTVKKSPNVKRVVTAEDLQRYQSAEFLVDLEKNTRMRISEIHVSGVVPAEKRREHQLTAAIHQALFRKEAALGLMDGDGNLLTELKLGAEGFEKVIQAKTQQLKTKEQELAEREARLAERESALLGGGNNTSAADEVLVDEGGTADLGVLTGNSVKKAEKTSRVKTKK